MSNIDQRIVDMQFNHKQFEEGIKDSVLSIDNLKKSLGSIDENDMRLSGISAGIESLSEKFSGLGIIAITALQNIVNRALDAGFQITKSLTLDPIIGGFSEYETKLGAIQTIMVNTASKGTTMKQVTDALDELNKYADLTIYSFSTMTENIGRFTASGVGLEDSVSAIKGISNLAAGAGSSANQAAAAMYNLSQSISANGLMLQDWNSVVNAGMGGPYFQNAILEAAVAMGELDKATMKAVQSGKTSFRALISGKDRWVASSEVLLKALGKMANDETLLVAATQVKTFTQLKDTLQESIESGWAETWEMVIGNKDEAVVTWTAVNNAIESLLKPLEKARNDTLSLWKTLGGRDILIKGISEAFEGLMSILTPIGKAFNQVFEAIDVKKLMSMTRSFTGLMISFELNTEQADKLQRTFAGLFSVIDLLGKGLKFVVRVVGLVVKTIFPMSDGILSVTAGIGDFLVGLNEAAETTDIFGKALEGIGKVLDAVKTGIGLTVGFVTTQFKNLMSFLKPYTDSLKNIGANILAGLLSGLSENLTLLKDAAIALGTIIVEAFKDFFGIHSPALLMITLAGMIVAGILLGLLRGHTDLENAGAGIGEVIKNSLEASLSGVRKIFDFLVSTFKVAADGIGWAVDKIKDYFSQFGGIDLGPIKIVTDKTKDLFAPFEMFATYASKAATAIKKAMATIGKVIKAGLKALGIKDLETLLKWMFSGGLLVLIHKFMSILEPFTSGFADVLDEVKDSLKAWQMELKSKALLNIAIAIGVLTVALVVLSQVPFDDLGRGILAISALVGELLLLSRLGGTIDMVKIGAGLSLLGLGLIELAAAMKILSTMSIDDLLKSGSAIATMILAFSLISKIGIDSSLINLGAGLALVGTGLLAIVAPLLLMAVIPFEWIVDGLKSVVIILGVVAVASKLTDGNTVLQLGGAMALLAAALLLLVVPITLLGLLPFGIIAKGLLTMAGALVIVSLVSKLVEEKKLVELGLALSAISVGLTVLAGAFLLLSLQSWESLVKGLVVFALALAALIGATHIVNETKLTKLGLALLSMAAILVVLTAAFMIISSLDIGNILETSVSIAAALLAIGGFVKIVGAIKVGEAAKSVLALLMFAGALALLTAPFILLEAFNVENMTDTMLALGGLMLATGLFVKFLGAVDPKSAAYAVLALAIFIAGVAAIIAILGGIAQIPGYDWLMSEGSQALTDIGFMLGEFMGSIVGGWTAGATSGFPEIGQNLSDFMTNLQPFIAGAKNMDEGVMDGLSTLVKVVVGLTVAEFLNALTWLVSGGFSSLKTFGTELSEFGKSLMTYYRNIRSIDPDVVEKSAIAAGAMAEVASKLEKHNGGMQLLAGDKSLSTFAKELAEFGPALRDYSDAVSGTINVEGIKASAEAALAMATVADTLQSNGPSLSAFVSGQKSYITFGRELERFGPAIRNYSNQVSGHIDVIAVRQSANAAEAMAEVAQKLVPHGDSVKKFLSGDANFIYFAQELERFGPAIRNYSNQVSGSVNVAAIIGSANAAEAMAEVAQKLVPHGTSVKKFLVGDANFVRFAQELERFGPAIRNYSTQVEGLKAEGIHTSATAAQSLAQMAMYLQGHGGILQKLLGDQSLSAFADELYAFGPALWTYSSKVAFVKLENINTSADAVKRLAEMAQGIYEVGKGMWGGFGLVTDFGTVITTFGDNYLAFYNSTANVNLQKVLDVCTALDTLLATAKSIDEANIKNLKTFSEDLKKQGDFGIAGFVTAFEGSEEAITTGVTTMTNFALAGFAKHDADYTTAGNNAVAGFVAGINGKSGDVTKAGESMGGDAGFLGAIKRTLGIASPSTEAEEVGWFTGEGFLNGLKGMLDSIVSFCTEMGSKALGGIQGALDNPTIKSAIDSVTGYFSEMSTKAMDGLKNALSSSINLDDLGFDTMPSITPVLDLSEIQNGSKDFEKMLADMMGQAGVTPNLDAITKSMSTDDLAKDFNANQLDAEQMIFQLTQNNYSPKALSRLDIYRQTNNQFAQLKGMVENAW